MGRLGVLASEPTLVISDSPWWSLGHAYSSILGGGAISLSAVFVSLGEAAADPAPRVESLPRHQPSWRLLLSTEAATPLPTDPARA